MFTVSRIAIGSKMNLAVLHCLEPINHLVTTPKPEPEGRQRPTSLPMNRCQVISKDTARERKGLASCWLKMHQTWQIRSASTITESYLPPRLVQAPVTITTLFKSKTSLIERKFIKKYDAFI